MRFDDKRVIVTGGAAGFGEAISRGFAERGARVMVTDIDADAAQALADELPGAMSFGLDVTQEVPHQQLAELMVDEWGGIDIVATNAGLPHRGGYIYSQPSLIPVVVRDSPELRLSEESGRRQRVRS